MYCKDELALDNTFSIIAFTNNNTTDSFRFTEKLTSQTGNVDKKP